LLSDRKKCLLCQVDKVIASQCNSYIEPQNSYIAPQDSYFVAQYSYIAAQDKKGILIDSFYLQAWANYVPVGRRLSSLIDSQKSNRLFLKIDVVSRNCIQNALRASKIVSNYQPSK